MVIGPVEGITFALVVAALFLLPSIIPRVGKKAGAVVERIRHADEDFSEGRKEIEDELGR